MTDRILEELDRIEATHDVRIVMAIESGSRAWGFDSPDSDYDVRFLYIQHHNQYLSIRDRKDVIELPVDAVLDVNGWDIRKALQLFHKSNSPLYEWLQSPIIYRERTSFATELRALMPAYYSARAGCHHYLSMARNVLEGDLRGERVRLKKYFYVLRPLLAATWIIRRGGPPPMEFGILRGLEGSPDWQRAVDELLALKKVSDEKALIEPVPLLQQWMDETLRQGLLAEPATASCGVEELDGLFRKYVLP